MANQPRIGLGCTRLSTEPDRDEPTAIAVLHAAFDAGITLLDIARRAIRTCASGQPLTGFGELTASRAPINLGVAGANGVAIMAPSVRDEY